MRGRSSSLRPVHGVDRTATLGANPPDPAADPPAATDRRFGASKSTGRPRIQYPFPGSRSPRRPADTSANRTAGRQRAAENPASYRCVVRCLPRPRAHEPAAPQRAIPLRVCGPRCPVAERWPAPGFLSTAPPGDPPSSAATNIRRNECRYLSSCVASRLPLCLLIETPQRAEAKYICI